MLVIFYLSRLERRVPDPKLLNLESALAETGVGDCEYELFSHVGGDREFLAGPLIRIGIVWLTESIRWHCPRGVVMLPVVDMKVRLPFNVIWKKDNSLPLLQKFVAQVQATRVTLRN
jgi:hypothetical protein